MKPTVGERLRELRTAKKLSQEQLAKIIGVSHNTVSTYESDMRQPSYDVLASLSRVFRVSTDYILGIESSCDDTSAAVIRDGSRSAPGQVRGETRNRGVVR